MPSIKSVEITNGSVSYNKGAPSVPASTRKEGNVTINTAASPGIASHYDVSFMLTANYENEGLERSNVFHWHCFVPSSDDNQSYREIETAAARQLAPLIRALADQIDKEVSAFDAAQGKKPPAA